MIGLALFLCLTFISNAQVLVPCSKPSDCSSLETCCIPNGQVSGFCSPGECKFDLPGGLFFTNGRWNPPPTQQCSPFNCSACSQAQCPIFGCRVVDNTCVRKCGANACEICGSTCPITCTWFNSTCLPKQLPTQSSDYAPNLALLDWNRDCFTNPSQNPKSCLQIINNEWNKNKPNYGSGFDFSLDLANSARWALGELITQCAQKQNTFERMRCANDTGYQFSLYGGDVNFIFTELSRTYGSKVQNILRSCRQNNTACRDKAKTEYDVIWNIPGSFGRTIYLAPTYSIINSLQRCAQGTPLPKCWEQAKGAFLEAGGVDTDFDKQSTDAIAYIFSESLCLCRRQIGANDKTCFDNALTRAKSFANPALRLSDDFYRIQGATVRLSEALQSCVDISGGIDRGDLNRGFSRIGDNMATFTPEMNFNDYNGYMKSEFNPGFVPQCRSPYISDVMINSTALADLRIPREIIDGLYVSIMNRTSVRANLTFDKNVNYDDKTRRVFDFLLNDNIYRVDMNGTISIQIEANQRYFDRLWAFLSNGTNTTMSMPYSRQIQDYITPCYNPPSCYNSVLGTFLCSGGTAIEFPKAFEQARQRIISESLIGCKRSSSNIVSCRGIVAAGYQRMGGDASDVDRVLSDSAQNELKSRLDVCVQKGGNYKTCSNDAIQSYIESGGDKSQLDFVLVSIRQTKLWDSFVICRNSGKSVSTCNTEIVTANAAYGADPKSLAKDLAEGSQSKFVSQYILCNMNTTCIGNLMKNYDESVKGSGLPTTSSVALSQGFRSAYIEAMLACIDSVENCKNSARTTLATYGASKEVLDDIVKQAPQELYNHQMRECTKGNITLKDDCSNDAYKQYIKTGGILAINKIEVNSEEFTYIPSSSQNIALQAKYGINLGNRTLSQLNDTEKTLFVSNINANNIIASVDIVLAALIAPPKDAFNNIQSIKRQNSNNALEISNFGQNVAKLIASIKQANATILQQIFASLNTTAFANYDFPSVVRFNSQNLPITDVPFNFTYCVDNTSANSNNTQFWRISGNVASAINSTSIPNRPGCFLVMSTGTSDFAATPATTKAVETTNTGTGTGTGTGTVIISTGTGTGTGVFTGTGTGTGPVPTVFKSTAVAAAPYLLVVFTSLIFILCFN